MTGRRTVSVVVLVLVLAALLGGVVSARTAPPPGVLWERVCPDFASVHLDPQPGGSTVVYCTLFNAAER